MAEKERQQQAEALDSGNSCQSEGPRIGTITSIAADGRILVDFPGNSLGPVPARLTTSAKGRLRESSPVGRDVLLVFEGRDPCRPVIIDTLYSIIDEITDQPADGIEGQAPEEVSVDRKRIVIDAEKEIVLRCGDASITLTSAGKVLIRGNYLLSRSAGANRIRGGSVQIN